MLWAVGVGLQYLVLSTLLHGPWRQLPVLLAYLICLTTTTLADIFLQKVLGLKSPGYRTYYWTAELARQTLLLALVVSFLARVVPIGRSRRMLVRIAVVAATLFWCGSLWLNWQPQLNLWMTLVVRNLSFCSAVLNLCLWFALISGERRDTSHLLLTGGLGLQMTGEAIGQSLRQLFPILPPGLAGALLTIFSHFLCLVIWWQAIRFQPVVSQSVRGDLA
ncbi:MAG: hypothetical protein H7Y20_18975 [Bryobacteraceae bacterium]|nr:hypothetical protein [Bryobacteraceae bacterium]